MTKINRLVETHTFDKAVIRLLKECKETGLLHLPDTRSKRVANNKYKEWLLKQK